MHAHWGSRTPCQRLSPETLCSPGGLGAAPGRQLSCPVLRRPCSPAPRWALWAVTSRELGCQQGGRGAGISSSGGGEA